MSRALDQKSCNCSLPPCHRLRAEGGTGQHRHQPGCLAVLPKGSGQRWLACQPGLPVETTQVGWSDLHSLSARHSCLPQQGQAADARTRLAHRRRCAGAQSRQLAPKAVAASLGSSRDDHDAGAIKVGRGAAGGSPGGRSLEGDLMEGSHLALPFRILRLRTRQE